MKKMKVRISLALIFIANTFAVFSQESMGGLPYTFKINTTQPSMNDYRVIAQQLNHRSVNPASNIQLQTQADSIMSGCSDCNLHLYGKEYLNSIDIIANATTETIDSTKVWRYEIYSSDASALQLYFSQFNLPLDGELFVYSADKKFVLGAFTAFNNDSTNSSSPIKFGTSPIPYDKIIIEYNQPALSSSIPQLVLHSVVHVFNVNTLLNKTNNSNSAFCETNINCPAGYGWDNEKKSVVLILAYSNIIGYYGTATGAMINNSMNTGAPYLLTAGHVIKNSSNIIDPTHTPASLMFLFNYETATCNTQQGTTQMNTLYSVFGSFELASKYDVSDYDYALLQLNTSKETLNKWGVCYAGWDKKTSLSALQKPSTMIHHPDGNEKSISVSVNSDLEPVQYVSDAFIDNSKGFFRTHWAIGAQEPGSSGAPVFDYYHRIVGILNGGPADCINEVFNNDWVRISKFSKSFTDGGLGFWLDPNNSNAQTVNSYCPPPIVDPSAANPDDPCQSVKFTINGQATNKVINVCTSDIWLNPSATCGNNNQWFFKRFEQKRNCSNIVDKWASTRCDLSFFNIRCHCYFLQLFLSVQECNNNLSLVGPEYSKWYYIYDGDQTVQQEPDNFKTFNFYGYFVPNGFVLQEGKYYKIKVASLNMNSYPAQWVEHSAYVKTYANNLYINNETITRNQIGTNIFISNSTVPLSAGSISVVATNAIKISPDSYLKTGRYYIHYEDCSTLNAYNAREGNNSDSSNTGNPKSVANDLVNNYGIAQHNPLSQKDNEHPFEVKVFPNPVVNTFNVRFFSEFQGTTNIELLDFSGKKIKTLLSNQKIDVGNFDFSFDMKQLPDGIYISKVVVNNKTYLNKFLKVSE